MTLKKLVTVGLLCLSAIGAQSDQVLDNLVTTSSSIATSMNTGLQIVGGLTVAASQGRVAHVGTIDTALISEAQRTAFNTALNTMAGTQYYGFEQFAEDRAQEALENMSEALDSFVDVTVELATVIEVADRAEIAQSNNDMQEKEELARFVEDNQEAFTVTESQVETWNESIEDVEEFSSTAAMWRASSEHEGAVAFMDSMAEQGDVSFTDVEQSYFNRDVGIAIVSWDQYSLGVLTDGINAYIDLGDVLEAGANTSLFLDGPTQTSYRCFVFNDCE